MDQPQLNSLPALRYIMQGSNFGFSFVFNLYQWCQQHRCICQSSRHYCCWLVWTIACHQHTEQAWSRPSRTMSMPYTTEYFWTLLEVQHCQTPKNMAHKEICSIGTQLPPSFLGHDSMERVELFDLILASDLQLSSTLPQKLANWLALCNEMSISILTQKLWDTFTISMIHPHL